MGGAICGTEKGDEARRGPTIAVVRREPRPGPARIPARARRECTLIITHSVLYAEHAAHGFGEGRTWRMTDGSVRRSVSVSVLRSVRQCVIRVSRLKSDVSAYVSPGWQTVGTPVLSAEP